MYFITVVLLLSWSPAVNLSIPGVDDMYPQSVRWQADHTCLVWESNIGGDWEIFSRFLIPSLPLYTDTFRITNNTGDDYNPVIAYDEARQCYWCAWMGFDNTRMDIFISDGDLTNGWSVPTRVTNDSSFDAEPSVCVIQDTVWLAWYKWTGQAFNIFAAYYDGSIWSPPVSITNDTLVNNTRPKINGHYDHPLVVWEKNDDIYFSECIAGIWQSPMPVTTDPGSDMKPEIAVQSYPLGGSGFAGAWIFWYSDRDGNCEIYSTAMDTFSVNRRVTFNDSLDYAPSPLDFIALIGRGDPASVAFSTSRNGGSDIYTLSGYYGWDTVAVDTNPSQDILPCMSGGDWRIWVFWQTDRNGDWDICGSQMWVGGVEEGAGYSASSEGYSLAARPNPFTNRTIIKFQISNDKLQMNAKDQTHPHPFPPPSRGRIEEGGREPKVSMAIYDAAGRTVKVFNHLTIQPIYQIIWDGTDDLGNPLTPGVYFCTMRQGGQAVTVKLIKTE
ncbi:MAG TPA: T9SS type A sorting domain-containing protein [bacterium]